MLFLSFLTAMTRGFRGAHSTKECMDPSVLPQQSQQLIALLKRSASFDKEEVRDCLQELNMGSSACVHSLVTNEDIELIESHANYLKAFVDQAGIQLPQNTESAGNTNEYQLKKRELRNPGEIIQTLILLPIQIFFIFILLPSARFIDGLCSFIGFIFFKPRDQYMG